MCRHDSCTKAPPKKGEIQIKQYVRRISSKKEDRTQFYIAALPKCTYGSQLLAHLHVWLYACLYIYIHIYSIIDGKHQCIALNACGLMLRSLRHILPHSVGVSAAVGLPAIHRLLCV